MSTPCQFFQLVWRHCYHSFLIFTPPCQLSQPVWRYCYHSFLIFTPPCQFFQLVWRHCYHCGRTPWGWLRCLTCGGRSWAGPERGSEILCVLTHGMGSTPPPPHCYHSFLIFTPPCQLSQPVWRHCYHSVLMSTPPCQIIPTSLKTFWLGKLARCRH